MQLAAPFSTNLASHGTKRQNVDLTDSLPSSKNIRTSPPPRSAALFSQSVKSPNTIPTQSPTVTFSETIHSFLYSKKNSLCLISDKPPRLAEFRQLLNSLTGRKIVFIGSDADCHTSKNRIKDADLVIIDYSNISQADHLNYLLEVSPSDENSKNPKVLGILSYQEFRKTADSFQSRWRNFIDYPSIQEISPTNKSIEILKDAPDNRYQTIEIHRYFSADIVLEKIDTSDQKPICLICHDINTPTLQYLQAVLMNQNKAFCVYQPELPKQILLTDTPLSTPTETFIHSGNFDCVNGEVYSENFQLKRHLPPQTICVIAPLSDAQWRYLGYLQTKQNLTIYIESNVSFPSQIEPQESSLIQHIPDNSEQATHLSWIQTRDPRTSEKLYAFYTASPSNVNVHRISITPQTRLSNFFTQICKNGNQFKYEESSLLSIFKDKNSLIIFDHLDCNPTFSTEFELMCLTGQFNENGYRTSISATILGLSERPPHLTHTLSHHVKNIEALIDISHPTFKTPPTHKNAKKMETKAELLKHHLTTVQSPCLLTGAPHSGKSSLLTKCAQDLNLKTIEIACSNITSIGGIEDQVLSWLNATEPTLLIIRNYTTLPYSFFNFLVPDSQNQIFIKGIPHKIQTTHRCFFIKDTSNSRKVSFENQLDTINFEDYSSEDISEIVTSWCLDFETADWLLDTWSMLKKHLDIQLSLFKLRNLLDLFTHFITQSNDTEDAKISSIYSLFTAEYSDESLKEMGRFLPVQSKLWNQHIETNQQKIMARQNLTEDQSRLQNLLSTFVSTYHQNPTQHPTSKPTFWIEGEAGCGKDYITDLVLESKGIKEVIRVKGSNLQEVLDQSKRAKKTGAVFIIEEADFICMDILKTILSSTHAHPKFTVIATVNGMSYDGRQRLTQAISEQLFIYCCKQVNDQDLNFMLASKFKHKLSPKDRQDFLAWYNQLHTPLSPRELFSIAEDYSNSIPIDYWMQHISTLKKIRSSRVCSKSNTAHSKKVIPKKIEPKLSIKQDKKMNIVTPCNFTSGISASQSPHQKITAQASTRFLPHQCYVEDSLGNFIRTRHDGIVSCTSKEGYTCLPIEKENAMLSIPVDDGILYLLLLPTGTQPKKITLFRNSTQKQDYEHPVSKNEQGFFFIHLSQQLLDTYSIIRIDYEEIESTESNATLPILSNSFEDSDFDLPRDIANVLLNDSLSPKIRLHQLHDIFKSMTFSDSEEIKEAYAQYPKGAPYVQRFLEIQEGCCYEFTHSFYALVVRYLKLPARLISGYERCGHNKFSKHVNIEVCIDGVWKQMNVTPPDRRVCRPQHKSVSTPKKSTPSIFEMVLESIEKDIIHSLKIKPANYGEETLQNKLEDIKLWCYSTGRIRNTTQATTLPSSDQHSTLCLDMYYRTSCEFYETLQLQHESWETDFQILITKNHETEIRRVSIFLELFFAIGCHIYLNTKSGVKKINSIEAIDWSELSNILPKELPPNMVLYDKLNEMLRYDELSFSNETIEDFFEAFEICQKNKWTTITPYNRELPEYQKQFELNIDNDITIVRRLINFFSSPSNQKSISHVCTLHLSNFSSEFQPEITKLVTLLRPNELTLINCPLPLVEMEIPHLKINQYSDIHKLIQFLRNNKIKSLTTFRCQNMKDLQKILLNVQDDLELINTHALNCSEDEIKNFSYLPSSLKEAFIIFESTKSAPPKDLTDELCDRLEQMHPNMDITIIGRPRT